MLKAREHRWHLSGPCASYTARFCHFPDGPTKGWTIPFSCQSAHEWRTGTCRPLHALITTTRLIKKATLLILDFENFITLKI